MENNNINTIAKSVCGLSDADAQLAGFDVLDVGEGELKTLLEWFAVIQPEGSYNPLNELARQGFPKKSDLMNMLKIGIPPMNSHARKGWYVLVVGLYQQIKTKTENVKKPTANMNILISHLEDGNVPQKVVCSILTNSMHNKVTEKSAKRSNLERCKDAVKHFGLDGDDQIYFSNQSQLDFAMKEFAPYKNRQALNKLAS